MNKTLAINTTYYTIGQILPKAVQFVLMPVYLKYLSPAEYGTISSVQVLVAVVTILYTLALDRSIFRLFFDFKGEAEKKTYLGTVFIGVIIISSFMTALMFVFPGVLGAIYKNIDFYPYISISILTIFFNNFSLVPLSTLYVRQRAFKYVSLSFLQFIITNLFIIYFVVFLGNGVAGYLKGQLFGAVLLMPLYLYLSYSYFNFTFDAKVFKQTLSFSLPILPSLLSAWIMNLSDRIFIERYIDSFHVGIYSFSYNIAALVLVVSAAFYKAYNPYYFKTASEAINRAVAVNVLKKTNTLYLLLIILLCFSISLFSREVVWLFFDEVYHEGVPIIGLISFSYIFANATGIFRLALYQEKRTKSIMHITFVGALLNVVLNYILIKPFGVYGAAYATIITYLLLFFIEYWYARKAYYASFDGNIVYMVFTLTVVTSISFFYWQSNFTWFSLFLKLLCMILLSLVIIKHYKLFLLHQFPILKRFI